MSSKSIDPIVILREYAIKSKPIKLIDGNLAFGHIKIPITAPTAWVSPFDDKQYSIGSIYFCLKNKVFDEKYLNDCAAYKVNFVSKMDMGSTLEYFTGKAETTDYIKEEIRQSTLITKEKKDEEEQKQATKDDIMDYVSKIEKRTTGRQEQMLSKVVSSLLEFHGSSRTNPRLLNGEKTKAAG